MTHLGQAPQTHAALAVALLTGNRLRHSTAMFRRDTALQAGGYDVGWFPVEDYDLWLRLLELGAYKAIPTVSVRCLDNPQGISSTYANEQAEASRTRSEISLRRWTGRARVDRGVSAVLTGHDGDPKTRRAAVRVLAAAVAGITHDLKQRGIGTCGAQAQGLVIAMGLYVRQRRVVRHLAILWASPGLSVRGRIERRCWQRR